MTTGLEDPRTALREALGQVNDVVGRVVRRLGDARPGDPADAELLGSGARALDALREELSRATGLVAARAGHAEWEARFGGDSWPEREGLVRERLAGDLDAGTAAWFDSWLGAVAAGAWEEAWRLLALDCRLADWAVWLPDRLAVVLQALETAPTDPARAAAQVTNLVDVLMADPGSTDHVLYGALELLGDDAVAGRIDLVLLVGRVLALAADPRAVPLVAQARRLLGAVGTGSEAALGRAVVATESFLERHGHPVARAGRVDGARPVAPGDLAAIHELAQRHHPSSGAADASGDGPGAVADAALMGEVQALVDSLKSVAGCASRLRTLLEPPSDELVLALVTRLVREEQLEAAAELFDRLWVPTLARPLRLRAAELAVTIAEARGGEPEEVARQVAQAGDQALWAGEAGAAVGHYTRALHLRPDSPETMRSLADALQVRAAQQEPAVAVADLHRALDLCERARALEPVTEGTSWALTLVRQAHQQLAALEPASRSEHLWAALGATVEALTAAPAGTDRWPLVVDDLTAVGLCHSAHVVAVRQRERTGATPTADRQLVMTLLNTGRAADALPLVESLVTEPGEDPGWVDGLRGYTHSMLGHREEAERSFALARSASRLLMYQEWSAAHLTRQGAPEAEASWQTVWRDSHLDDMEEVGMAAWAALYQRLFPTARELATRLAPAERLVVGIRTSAVTAAVVDVVTGDRRSGWGALESAFGGALVVQDLDRAGDLVRAVLRRSGAADADDLVATLDPLTAEVRARLERDLPADPGAAMAVELDRVDRQLREPLVSTVVGRLSALVRDTTGPVPGHADDDPGAREDPADVPEAPVDDTVLPVVMPPSWFADWEGRETEHEFFVRGLPFARAAVRRAGELEVAALTVRVRVDDACEPDQVWVELPDGVRRFSGVEDGRWYCPRSWLVGQRPLRQESAEPSPLPDLLAVAAPQDATERVGSWSSAETVARLVLDAAAGRPTRAGR